MEREQRIVIELGEASGNPDAEAAMRNALLVFQLLDSVDKNAWQVGNPRYHWEIVAARKSSPLAFEAVGRPRNPEHRSDVVGALYKEMSDLERDAQPNRNSLLRVQDLKRIAILGRESKHKAIPVRITIPSKEGRIVQFSVTPQMRRHAKMRILQIEEEVENTKPFYAVVEGLLRSIEADPRERKKKYALGLIERGTEAIIRCQFDPSDSEELGAHVGNRIFVEGTMTADADGRRHLEVAAFRLIPKKPLTDAELREYGIRTPDGMDAARYIEGLRAEHE